LGQRGALTANSIHAPIMLDTDQPDAFPVVVSRGTLFIGLALC